MNKGILFLTTLFLLGCREQGVTQKTIYFEDTSYADDLSVYVCDRRNKTYLRSRIRMSQLLKNSTLTTSKPDKKSLFVFDGYKEKRKENDSSGDTFAVFLDQKTYYFIIKNSNKIFEISQDNVSKIKDILNENASGVNLWDKQKDKCFVVYEKYIFEQRS